MRIVKLSMHQWTVASLRSGKWKCGPLFSTREQAREGMRFYRDLVEGRER